jgi:NADP-dependent aldehyde dehydrogenase
MSPTAPSQVESVAGFDPRTGQPTGFRVDATSAEELAGVTVSARQASGAWAATLDTERAAVLRGVADALDAAGPELVATADKETALGSTRLAGEVTRTTNQLRMFAAVVSEGSYREASISHAVGAAGRPDVRRILFPLGPVGVFAASNFPFAFSVAGGDTASALAAGCPVVVKAHPAHPETSVATAAVVARALATAGTPDGVFAMVHGHDTGLRLVQDPAITAVGFTGSGRGGRALFDAACRRLDPIPFHGELGSVNPVVVLPSAAAERGEAIATGYAGSLTLGAGQFCTKPGLLFVPADSDLLAAIADAIRQERGGVLLTEGIRDAYVDATADYRRRTDLDLVAVGSRPQDGWAVAPCVYSTTADKFAEALDELSTETFGPSGIAVTYRDVDELVVILAQLEGALVGCVHAGPAEPGATQAASAALAPRVGRLVFNGWPTGVEVCWAMHHGGPWPATTDPHHTSVGATAIARWLRPIAYQDWPDELLPAELQQANPWAIARRLDDVGWTR